jgi:hypothetical protein
VMQNKAAEPPASLLGSSKQSVGVPTKTNEDSAKAIALLAKGREVPERRAAFPASRSRSPENRGGQPEEPFASPATLFLEVGFIRRCPGSPGIHSKVLYTSRLCGSGQR